ncbi:hypothetical protein BGZ63DRAFT_388455 [Mariannaea sp. PMI_226]|nr:hypothetical protein BGZ63DRAFT_388455 [Mariannaea sp. PMI_226]
MSGIEVVGLIAAIIEITDSIVEVYAAIKDLRDLPNAFQEVNKRLPIVEIILQSARSHAENAADYEAQALVSLLKSCKSKADQLLEIFKRIDDSKDKPVVSVYRKLVVKIGKKGRVEVLMTNILRDVETLTSYHVFRGSTKDQVEKVKEAILELAQVEPSMPDSHFEEKAANITHNGRGNIYSNCGPGNFKHVDGHNFEAKGDIHFGKVPEFYKSKRSKDTGNMSDSDDIDD